ncbi:MAG: class I SAM-dependent methyltransferase [archaeon]
MKENYHEIFLDELETVDNLEEVIKNIDRINLGCGYEIKQGWLNIGLFYEEYIKYNEMKKIDNAYIYHIDILDKFPVAENSINYIYASHLIEHFDFNTGIEILKRCYQSLKKGGVIRLIFPDLKLWIEKYINNDDEFFNKYYNHTKKYGLPDLRTNGEIFVTQFFNWGHKWGYDFESIKDVLGRVGFTTIIKKEINDSLIPNIKYIENQDEIKKMESIYIDVIK